MIGLRWMEETGNPLSDVPVTEPSSGLIGWLRDLWDTINIKQWTGDLSDSSAEAVQVAMYFVSSFAIGFLFKKYLKFIFVSLIMALFIVKFMEYHRVLDIDWEALNVLIGLEPTATFTTIFDSILVWVRANLVVTLASTIGFLIGYKLG